MKIIAGLIISLASSVTFAADNCVIQLKDNDIIEDRAFINLDSDQIAICGTNVRNVIIRRVEFSGTDNARFIKIEKGDDIYVESTKATFTGPASRIYEFIDVDRVKFIQNTVSNTGASYLLSVTQGREVHIENNIFDTTNSRSNVIRMDQIGDHIIRNNTFNNSEGYGIFFGNHGGTNSVSGIVEENTFNGISIFFAVANTHVYFDSPSINNINNTGLTTHAEIYEGQPQSRYSGTVGWK